MTADLGFVMRAAEADADEFAAGGAGDALPERGLADAGRADKAQDRAAALRVELVDRQVFEDAPLDLGEPEMVGVEDAAGLGDVDRLAGLDRPRQLDQPFEIGARHRIFAGRLGHPLEPGELALGVLLDLGRHLRLGDLFRELGDLLALGVVALAQFLLDRLHLLAQQELALAVVDLFLGLLADLARQPQHLDAVDQHRRHPFEPALDIDGFEDLLLFGRGDVHKAGDQIGERRGGGGRLHGVDQLDRGLRQQLQDLDRLVAQIEHPRLDVLAC